MLHTPDAHEPLVSRTEGTAMPRSPRSARSPPTARAAFQARPSPHWPVHPRDGAEDKGPTAPSTSARRVSSTRSTCSRAGVSSTGSATTSPALEDAVEAYRAAPSSTNGHATPSLWMGETGIRSSCTGWRRPPGLPAIRRARHRGPTTARAREFMWGSPGTMLAARVDRPDLWRESADRLRDVGGIGPLDAGSLWARPPVPRPPAPGFAVCRGAAHEPDDELHGRASDAFKRYAVEKWSRELVPLADGPTSVQSDGTIRVQWCHGAAGMVTCLAHWRRTTSATASDACRRRARVEGRPAREEPGLCHGTAGNGFAFLELLARTGDERWLDRAARSPCTPLLRSSASEQGRPGDLPLWTGDPGTALYLALCLDGRAFLPGFDDNEFA